MKSAALRLWYGTAQIDRKSDVRLISWRWLLVAAALLGVRLALPLPACDTGILYGHAANTLLDGGDWSKQMLVGVMEYPPFPLIVLTLTSGVFRLFAPGSIGAALPLALAVAQVWVLLYCWRLFRLYFPGSIAGAGAAGCWFVLAAATGQKADPAWIIAVPAIALIFHAARLEKTASLRDVSMIGLAGGLLALSGLAGITMAVTACILIRSVGGSGVARPGAAFLLFMPLVYVLALYPLANWLVMGDPFYFVHRLFAWETITAAGTPAVLLILAVVAALASAIAGVRLGARLAVVGAISMLALSVLMTRCGLFLADFGIITGIFAVAGILGVMAAVRELSGHHISGAATIAAVLLAMSPLLSGLPANRERAVFSDTGAPDPDSMFKIIDPQWQDSRILLFDLRSTAMYANHPSQRFVANLDFNKYVFEKQIRDEQFHLLVPPNNGRFYPPGHPFLPAAHDGQDQHLFLENVWPNGWQLWRCVRPIRPEALGTPPAAKPVNSPAGPADGQ